MLKVVVVAMLYLIYTFFLYLCEIVSKLKEFILVPNLTNFSHWINVRICWDFVEIWSWFAKTCRNLPRYFSMITWCKKTVKGGKYEKKGFFLPLNVIGVSFSCGSGGRCGVTSCRAGTLNVMKESVTELCHFWFWLNHQVKRSRFVGLSSINNNKKKQAESGPASWGGKEKQVDITRSILRKWQNHQFLL